MTDHKFTDEENILLLLKWSDDLYANTKLTPEEAKTLLDLINRQKAEIESLNAVHADMTESLRLAAEANKDMQAEIERLTAERDEARQDCAVAERNHQLAVAEREANVKGFTETLKTIKAEAIKEFAERFKEIDVETFEEYDKWGLTYVSEERIHNAIDSLVKEMTEAK